MAQNKDLQYFFSERSTKCVQKIFPPTTSEQGIASTVLTIQWTLTVENARDANRKTIFARKGELLSFYIPRTTKLKRQIENLKDVNYSKFSNLAEKPLYLLSTLFWFFDFWRQLISSISSRPIRLPMN